MPSRTNTARWAPAAFALCGALAWPAVARADFEVTYLFTDDEGNALINDRLTPQEMQSFVNQATCQCGQQLAARVYLNRTTGTTTYPGNTRVRTYVGAKCDQGQDNISDQQRPCVKVHEGQANDYDDGGIFITFDAVWLSSRTPTLEARPDDAEPIMPCSAQEGGGGIWICVESNDQPECQRDEFVVMGDSSTNGGTGTTPTTPTDPMGGMAPTNNVSFDYLPPQDSFTGFRAEPGDGHVEVRWDRGEVADTSGFRVLCADMDGNPVKEGITSVPTGQQRVNGKLYYTASSLCPGDVVHEPEPSDPGSDPFGGTGTTGEMTTTDDGATGDGTTGDAVTDDGRATDAGSTTAGDPGGGSTSCDDPSSSVLCSLDWRYVCSEHVSSTGSEADVTGLQNGTPYQFLVVAYDGSGNATPVSDVFVETPAETSDFWEQCEQQGDLCGDGGFCACRSSSAASRGAGWLGVGLLLLGVAARRRRIGG